MSSAPYYACQAPGLAVDGFCPRNPSVPVLPKVQAFPSASQQDMAVAIKFEERQAFGGFAHGMARGERTAQGSCCQVAEFGLAMGIYRSQKRRRKKVLRTQCCRPCVFFRKNNHSNNSLRSCTYSWGRKLPKVGTGDKQRVSNCTVLSSLLTHPFPEEFGILCLGWFVGVVCCFFLPFRRGLLSPISARRKHRRNVCAPDMWWSCPSLRLCGCRSAPGRAEPSPHPGATGDVPPKLARR